MKQLFKNVRIGQMIVPVIAIALMALGTDASAQGTTSALGGLVENVSKPLCEVYKILTGWLTLLLIVIAVAAGGLMKLFGNRNWSSMIIGALVAGVIVLLSGAVVKIVITNGELNCQDGTRLNQKLEMKK